MKKNTRENKNRVMREVKLGTEAIFDLSAKAEKMSYTNDLDVTVEEEPGKYKGAMSCAMLGDMLRFGLFLYSVDEKLSEELGKVKTAMDERDITLRRMFDDRKGKRPLLGYSFEKSEALVKTLLKIKEADIYGNPTCKRYEDKLITWTERIIKQDIWAYSLQCLESFDENRRLADFRAFDDDGNIVYGIPESDATSVHLITSMQEILVRALVRLPVMSDELQNCMAKIELIDVLVQAILSQDEEKIDFLAKCAEAAEEFSD